MAYSYLIGALLALLALFAPAWIELIELPVFIALVGTVGILHGALDHKVAFRHYKLREDRRGWMVFLAAYLGIMVAYAAVWVLLPAFSLVLFIALSVWHFGQSDMEVYQHKSGTSALTITRSLAVLGMILGFHIEETRTIIDPIITLPIQAQHGLLIAFSSYALHTLSLLIYRPNPLPKALFDIHFLAIISYVLPLLLAFAVYFALWHSVQHLHVLRRYLEYDHWWPLVRTGLPFTILAVLFLAALGLYLPESGNSSQWIFYAFVGISLMTMPHMILVDRMMGEGKGDD